MWGKIWKTARKPHHLQSDCLQHQSQVASETLHGANVAETCQPCLEENTPCKCDHSIEYLRSTDHVEEVSVEQNAEANCSFTHAVINMVGMLLGLGQLSTPYALETGGWGSVFLLVGLGVVCAYGSHLLGKCLEKNPKLRNYIDIGEHAFGAKGRNLATTFLYLDIFMALVSYTISLHDNLVAVFLGTRLNLTWAKLSTSQLLTVMAVLVALPSLWLKDLSSISFLSSGGILMSLLIFTSVALTALFGVVKTNQTIPFLQLHNIPSISGLYLFSYAGHIVIPNLYKSMKDPSKFTQASIVSFSIVVTLYTSLAFMGAKMFGPEVNSQITLSMPRHFFMTKIALWATVITPMTKYALEFAPCAIQLEHGLPSFMSKRTKIIIRGCLGSFLLSVILVLALSVPFFEHVLSLTGSLVSVAICVVLPCGFYTKICWGDMPKPLAILNLSLVAFGVIIGVFGTISSSKSLVRSLQEVH